ncbi:hypothetical protein ACUSIJ_15250 [Pseudochelatococcus sp. B33]
MTLDGFIQTAFPVDGRLDQLTCGHAFLNEYKGCTFSLGESATPRFQTKPDGNSPVFHADPESTEAEAARYAREEERRRHGCVTSPALSVFDRITACTVERLAFGERLQAHLAPRLGTLYAEFEKRINAPRVFRSSSTPLSFDEIAGFSTAAYEVMYLADAKSEIEALRARSIAAFEAVQLQALSAEHDPSYRCVQCVSREISTEVQTLSGSILERAPDHYKPLLARLVKRAIADVGQAREEAVRMTSVPASEVGQGPLLPQSISVSDSGGGRVAAVSSGGTSLLQRLFGCCFPSPA